MRSTQKIEKRKNRLLPFFAGPVDGAQAPGALHDVFISYARPDFPRIEPLLEKIKDDLGLSIWIDLKQLEAGDAWRNEIDSNLSAAHAVVVFLSAHALTSDAVLYELKSAIAQKKPILPIYLRPVHETPSPEWNEVRRTLSAIQYIDLSQFGGGDGWVEVLGAALKKLEVPALKRRRFREAAARRSARIPSLSRMTLAELQAMPREKVQAEIQRLQLALTADPADPSIQFSLGLLHLARKSYSRARAPLQAAAAVLIDDAYAQLYAGAAMIAGRAVRKLPIGEGGDIFQFLRPAYEKGFEQSEIVWFMGAFVYDFYVLNFLEPPKFAQYDFTPETIFDRAQSLTPYPAELKALLEHAQFSDKILRVLRSASDEAIDQIKTDELVSNSSATVDRERIEKFFSLWPADNPGRKAIWAAGYAVAACLGWLVMLAAADGDAFGAIFWTLISPLLYVPVYSALRRQRESLLTKPLFLWLTAGVAIFHVFSGFGSAAAVSNQAAFIGHSAAVAAWFAAAIMAQRAYNHYVRRAKRATDREVDLAILLDRQRTEQSFNQLADFDGSDRRISAEVIYGISHSLRDDEDGYVWHYGEDGFPRVATHIVLMATFTEHQLIIYKAVFDLREDFIAQQTQHELFFRDIDTITIEIGTTQAKESDEGKKAKSGDSQKPKPNTKRNARFIIRTTGGSVISVPLYDEAAGEKIDKDLQNRNDAAISAIRYRVQAKKTELRLAAITRIEEENLYANVEIADEDPLLIAAQYSESNTVE